MNKYTSKFLIHRSERKQTCFTFNVLQHFIVIYATRLGSSITGGRHIHISVFNIFNLFYDCQPFLKGAVTLCNLSRNLPCNFSATQVTSELVRCTDDSQS